MSSDPEKAELERERRELRQMRAELERQVTELDKRQSRAVVAERRGSMGKTEGSGWQSPVKADRGFSQQSSSDLDRSLMQVTSLTIYSLVYSVATSLKEACDLLSLYLIMRLLLRHDYLYRFASAWPWLIKGVYIHL